MVAFESGKQARWLFKYTTQKRLSSNVFWQRWNHLFSMNFPHSLSDADNVFLLLGAGGEIPALKANGWSNEEQAGFIAVEYIDGSKLECDVLDSTVLKQLQKFLSRLETIRVENPQKEFERFKKNLKTLLESDENLAKNLKDEWLKAQENWKNDTMHWTVLDIRWDQFLWQEETQQLTLLDLDAVVIAPESLILAIAEFWLTQSQLESVYPDKKRANSLKDIRPLCRYVIQRLQLFGDVPFEQIMQHPVYFD